MKINILHTFLLWIISILPIGVLDLGEEVFGSRHVDDSDACSIFKIFKTI